MNQTNLKYNTETHQKYPQSFTGKERDSETGFSYFGARYYDSDLMTGWLSVDPMADKYPGLSPYAYCAWNPVKLVDPDGRMVEEPPTKWNNIEPVIPKKLFVGWKRKPYREEIMAKNNGREPNCNDYTRKQLELVGCVATGSDSKNNLYPYQEKTGVDIQQTKKAILYIQGQLEQNIPVMIGVDEGVSQNINEGTTDHFLVIVGQGNDKKGNYFLVYDNARGNTEEGTSDLNRIYLQEDGRLYGEMQRPNNRYVPYTISQVRPTSRKKKINNEL